MTPPLNILLADDHEVVREGLASILNRRASEFRVVAEASDGAEALALWQQHAPDLGILDLRMPGLDGVATIKAIRAVDPAAKLVILTTYDTDEDIYQGLRSGAKGYILKDAGRESILDAIRSVARGHTWIPPEVATKLTTRIQSEALTDKEAAILQALARGGSNKEIAREIGISEGTVKFHTSNIYGKLGVDGRAEAIQAAMKRGLIKL